MGRAIVRQPKAFLMDEPLSNLDAKLRVQMRADIAKLQRDLKVTTVYVTHDQVEAMTMGDRVAVLNRGVLMQVDTPQNLYDAPANLFVAAFIGSPQMNLVRGTAHVNGSDPFVMVGPHRLSLGAAMVAEHPHLAGYDGREIAIGVRPEDVSDTPGGDILATNTITGEMAVREGLGNEVVAHLKCDLPNVNVVVEKDEEPDVDTSVFIARLNPRTPLQVGDQATLYVDTNRLHFFDLETSNAID
jgi:multiple sugar transport system ATP-binding protein